MAYITTLKTDNVLIYSTLKYLRKYAFCILR